MCAPLPVSADTTVTGSFGSLAWTYDKDGNRHTETRNAGIMPYIHPTVQKP